MDDIFGDDDFFDISSRPISFSPTRHSRPLFDIDNDDLEKIYFVPYRWWREAREALYGNADDIRGVLYAATSSTCPGPVENGSGDTNSEIVLNLRMEAGDEKSNRKEGGVLGREYALVPESMWLQALKWHDDSNEAVKDVGSFLAAEDHMHDVFQLQVRLFAIWETNSLVVKINQKDNGVEFYRKACDIFLLESELLLIWDFSGQTTLLLVDEKSKLPSGGVGLSDEEIILKLQVFVLSNFKKAEEGMKDEMTMEQFEREDITSGHRTASFLGLKGLQNLGNTCFMNTAIQCLVHIPELVYYFLGNYNKEINYENPLGMQGELALAFGDLLRKLWAPGATPVVPRTFKLKLASFASQFSGFNQHDSQEFLAFLLDGLHEDLNRVKFKPYIESGDAEGHPDEEVGDEYWQNHQARNDSIIVDLFQGQYRSKLFCPVCKKESVTFDPFMYLSLPVPSATMRSMTLTIFNSDGTTLPISITVCVPSCGTSEDLIQALSNACFLRNDETLLVVEIFNNRILRYLEDPSDALALIRDDDRLAAYRLPKDSDSSHLLVFRHYRPEKDYFGPRRLRWKMFGVPLVARMSNPSKRSDIQRQFLKLLNPFLMAFDDALDDGDGALCTANEDTYLEDNMSLETLDGGSDVDSESEDDPLMGTSFQFHFSDVQPTKDTKIKKNDPILISELPRRLTVSVCWPDSMIDQYDTCLLSSLPEVAKLGFFERRPQESVSLYKCLELFLKEEPLGPEDMWYCPNCKKHQQANKKLDLWRLPEILVIHLKRFSYSPYSKRKLETFIDFPVDDLDLSKCIAHGTSQLSRHYMLYAVSNHYGGMGGGHYTALVHHERGRWYEFDDVGVHPVSEDELKTSAAYVLFYRRVVDV